MSTTSKPAVTPEMVEKARQVAAHISEQFNDRGRGYDNQPSLEELADTLAEFAASAVQEVVSEGLGKLLELRIMLEEDGYTKANIAMQTLNECDAALREKYGVKP